MRTPITDTFLRGLYATFEEAHRIADYASVKTMYQAIHFDLFRLKREYARLRARKTFDQFLAYLQKHGYITVRVSQNKKEMLLTPRGAEKILFITLRCCKKQRRADKKWQMIMFDIPEKKRKVRGLLRKSLILLGYQKLQGSVWACQYQVEKETERVLQQYDLVSYVKNFLVESI